MYLGDQVDHAKKPNKDAIKPKVTVNKFGCATLPTKLRQIPSLNHTAKVYGPRQSSAPQMNPTGFTEKLAAKRQSSAPQIR